LSIQSTYIANLFTEVINFESAAESIKESLSMKSDFCLANCFKLFDRNNVGNITLHDFKDTIFNLNIISSGEIIKKVFKKFDYDKDGKLIYLEFCNMISPKKLEYSNLLRNRKRLEDNEQISIETELLIVKLFKTLVDNESQIESFKANLIGKINYLELFDEIKIVKDKNYITKEDVIILYNN